MNKNTKLFKILINLDIVITSIALIILVGCTFTGVIMRYIVGKPFGWIEEIQAFLIVWVVFLAGGAAYRTGNHASIEILYELFPGNIQKLIRLFIGIIVTASLGYMCFSSISYLKLFSQTGRGTAVLQIPFVYIYSVIPLSCILQIFNYFLVNTFGYVDEVEKLVEDSENE